MKAFIVDSSVVAKWLPPLNNEPLASEARVLLADWTRGKIELSVPDLLLIEVANVLWKATRAGRCKAVEARTYVASLNFGAIPETVRNGFCGTRVHLLCLTSKMSHAAMTRRGRRTSLARTQDGRPRWL